MEEIYTKRAEIISELLVEGYNFHYIAHVMNLPASECQWIYETYTKS